MQVVTTEHSRSLADRLSAIRPPLERALVARFGLSDGMDAAADAVEWALRHPSRFDRLSNAGAYLYRIGCSRVRRAHLLAGRRWNLRVELPEPDVAQRIDLVNALAALRPSHRAAVMLVHCHGYTYEEASAVLGVPVTTLTNHVARGLRRLRSELGKESA